MKTGQVDTGKDGQPRLRCRGHRKEKNTVSAGTEDRPTQNVLAEDVVFKSRQDTAKMRKLREKSSSGNKKQTELKGAIRSIEGDVTDDVTQVSAGRGRKDYN